MCNPTHTPGGLRYGLTPTALAPHLRDGFGEYVYLHPYAVVQRISPAVPVDVAPLFVPLSNASGGWHVPCAGERDRERLALADTLGADHTMSVDGPIAEQSPR